MKDFTVPIPVTKSYLPPLEEYVAHLKDIWESGWVTNHGPKSLALEKELARFLGVKHAVLVNNGTIAIQIALRAAQVTGEVLTTPFSYVATTSSLVWEGLKPVFVDIEPHSLGLDPEALERAVTPQTSAILGVHVYGYPCEVEAIAAFAKRKNLKVIYDAAHAFGATMKGQSLCTFGDVSTLSFHATKLFHTVEGGAILTNDDDIAHRASYLRNFGHDGPEAFQGLGINGKNSEVHAAMGLCVLPALPKIMAHRKAVCAVYDATLNGLQSLSRPRLAPGTDYNWAYYPVIFDSQARLLAVRTLLNANDVFPRRYFFPSLNTLPYLLPQRMPVAERVAERVLCLPLWHDLPLETAKAIGGWVRSGCETFKTETPQGPTSR
jgi:dTDP-4-amino-4,6-dideoxygalactose transaminase